MIQIGDNVRFLNARGGGRVVRVDDKQRIVFVQDEDGFEIPTLEKDCVVIPKVNEKTNFPMKDFSSKRVEVELEKEMINEPTLVEIAEEPIAETEYGDVLNVLLAFIPENVKKIQSTNYECVLVNDCNYFLLYNVVNDSNISVSNGIIEPNMQEVMAVITKDELCKWEKFRVQFVAFKREKAYMLQPTHDLAIELDTTSFYKYHTFTENDYFDEPCMLIDLVALRQEILYGGITNKEIEEVVQAKDKIRRRFTLNTDAKQKKTLEVDLHIHQLTDNISGMTNGEMIQLQLAKFELVMNENLKNKGQKIVFIHGKGEGVLRKEIEKLLKTKYPKSSFQDASFREYGFGATMVTVR